MNNLPLANSQKNIQIKNSSPYRVMIVDDSSVIRGVLSRWLSADSSLEIVASVAHGQAALNILERANPEIIVLDIEMPVMDGMTALPLILKAMPNVQILMSSTLTSKNAQISLKAMSLGAADYLPKPTTNRDVMSSQSFQTEIIEKIKHLAEAKRRQLGIAVFKDDKKIVREVSVTAKSKKDLTTREFSRVHPKVIGVGSSTGGPQALLKFLNGIKDDLSLPMVITQHMPATFTKILAVHISKSTGLDCKEAEDGMILEPGHVYIAPGEYHMVISKENGVVYLRLNQDEAVNFCRPSVDPMFKSLSDVYGSAVLGVILTGMGHDGLSGSKVIVEEGGAIIAQDQQTSVVWGMPGAVSEAGICSSILPLEQIADKVKRIIKGGR